jgi:hypothetical protein
MMVLASSRRPWPRLARATRFTAEVAIAAVTAVVVGGAAGSHRLLAIGAAGALASLWLLVRPSATAVALGLSIPALENLAGGHLGVNLTVTDFLLLLATAAAIGSAIVGADGAVFRALRPVAFPLLQYCAFLLVLLAAHLGRAGAVQTVQRLELVVLPVLAGCYLATRRADLHLLQAYVAATTAVAAIWHVDHLSLQKNPAGQLMANAIVVLVGFPRLGRLRLVLPVLVYGLFTTESRGAIVACAIGLGVVFLVRGFHAPKQVLAQLAALAAVVAVAFQVMPAGVQSRITSFSSQGGSAAAFTVRVRTDYRHDAIRIADAHPWFGVGVGSYLDGVREFHLTEATDPHNVVLLQAAEGGWPFAGSFVVLVVGAVLGLARLWRSGLAAVAFGLMVSTVAHGMVDVYWVRGTPVLSWLVVGMVCGAAWRERT